MSLRMDNQVVLQRLDGEREFAWALNIDVRINLSAISLCLKNKKLEYRKTVKYTCGHITKGIGRTKFKLIAPSDWFTVNLLKMSVAQHG